MVVLQHAVWMLETVTPKRAAAERRAVEHLGELAVFPAFRIYGFSEPLPELLAGAYRPLAAPSMSEFFA